MKKEKGFNIDTTKGQYMMLYNIIAEYNPKDADPNFDMQTFDNLFDAICKACLLYTSPSPRDKRQSRMPSSA